MILAAAAVALPPAGEAFDYQLGGDYPPPGGAEIVVRDWFSGAPLADPGYSICYVNAFQTQPNERRTNRPDERANWPRSLVLDRLGDDPKWGGEYLIDISTKRKRRRAARWVEPMIDACAERGFEAVEFDNLDSWTRFDGTPLARRVPFGRGAAMKYARGLAGRSHDAGLAVAQKNVSQLPRRTVRKVGFDFVIAEECGRYRECRRYARVHRNRVLAIEYRRKDFRRACKAIGDRVAVILRDRLLRRPGAKRYVYDSC